MAETQPMASASKGNTGTPDTANISLITRQITISRTFLARLIEAGLTPREAVRGILVHEIGHYSVFPWDYSQGLYLGHVAEADVPNVGGGVSTWPKEKYGRLYWHIVALYTDVVDNLHALATEGRKDSVASLYRAMARMRAPEDRIHHVVDALYQKLGNVDLGVSLDGDTMLEERLAKLCGINYFHDTRVIQGHATSMLQFGHATWDLFPSKADRKAMRFHRSLPPPPYYDDELEQIVAEEFENVRAQYIYPLLYSPPTLVDHIESGGDGEGEDGDDDSDSDDSDFGDVKCPEDMSNKELNDALSKHITRHSRLWYDLAKKFLRRVKPDFKDEFEPDPSISAKIAGLSGGDTKIQDHSDHVAYYKRLSATYGLFIAPKPMTRDAHNLHPSTQTEFNVGDNPAKLNPWSTPFILPGLTMRYEDKMGTKLEVRIDIPDLFVHLDSSGSMKSAAQKSEAVLAAFILGRNYYANGKLVGLNNFSTDMALLYPTRDIEMYYALACAYWGQGTVLNLDRFKEWLAAQQRLGDRRLQGVQLTTPEDYKKMIEKLTESERKQFEEKNLTVKIRELEAVYEKLDNVLISDGAIANIPDIVDWMNKLAKWTRNTIFVVESPKDYEAWTKLGLKNTTIYNIESKADLVGVAIGFVRKVMRPVGEYARK